VNKDRYSDLLIKAAENNDADLEETLLWIGALNNEIKELWRRLESDRDEYIEMFGAFRGERDRADALYRLALKMYEKPEKARELFLAQYGDPDEDE